MNALINLARFHHWPAAVGLLAIACLTSSTALAQRPSIAAQQAQIATLQSQVASLQTNNVPGLGSYVSVDTSVPSRPKVLIVGANLQVENGLGSTSTVNGLGNVIVGYDEPTGATLPLTCSLGQYFDLTSCTGNGGTWALSFKTGSHNVVVGPYHRYSRSGGFVAGSSNTLNGDNASVTGGTVNMASGFHAAVSGGRSNTVLGDFSSISGGYQNDVSGQYGSISGGFSNIASGDWSSISGGEGNWAFGSRTSISGGIYNDAHGNWTTITGGSTRTVTTDYFWVGGNSLLPQ